MLSTNYTRCDVNSSPTVIRLACLRRVECGVLPDQFPAGFISSCGQFVQSTFKRVSARAGCRMQRPTDKDEVVLTIVEDQIHRIFGYVRYRNLEIAVETSQGIL